MKARRRLHNHVVAALVPFFLAAGIGAAGAETAAPSVDTLLERLQGAENAGAASRIEREIWREWSKSGSPAMDLLLQRGRDAMQAGDMTGAIEHLTALVDHAPDFAEGWNARATAYFQAGQYGAAVADIQTTLRLNPRHFGALSGFAMILDATGREAEALEVYRAALAIHPHLEGVRQSVERLERKAAGQEL
jgi:tetratricopeptide (TPR) repeat protein